MPTAGSSGPVGGCARPSLRWQDWQERALNSGPRPSEDCVEEGAVTQSLRKKPLPTLKSSSRSKDMLADEREKALASGGSLRVAAPPGSASKRSGAAKSVAGAVTAATRAASAAVRGTTLGDGPPAAPAAAAAGMRISAQASRFTDGYWNTASGLSRLSEPSKAIAERSSAVTARSIERVWATSALTPPITSASPAALPVASSWS